MPKRGSGSDSFWLWDGDAEYEGALLASNERDLTARLRQVRRFMLSAGGPGRPVPLDLLERQRLLSHRVCFAQSPALLLGRLLEFRIHAVQPCRDPQFDFVLAGTFGAVPDEQLEALSHLSTDGALRYLQSRRTGQSGESSDSSGR